MEEIPVSSHCKFLYFVRQIRIGIFDVATPISYFPIRIFYFQALPKFFEPKTKNLKQCPEKDCKFVCASLSVLTNHKIRQHMAKVCKFKSFEKILSFVQHAMTRLWCRLCGRTCKDRTALFLHKKWKHTWKNRKPHKMHVPFMLLEAVGRDYMKALVHFLEIL